MYDIPTIKTNLSGVVGWRQPLETEFAIVDAPNLLSSSGLIFQGFHSLVTIANLKNVVPESLSDADFNTFIFDMQKDAIAQVVQSVFQKKKPLTKALLDKLRLYDNANIKDDPIPNVSKRWVGFKIDLNKNNNIKVVIDALGSEFDSITNLTIFLFHSSQKAAIKTFALTTLLSDSKFDDLADFVLDYLTFIGGTYYIGYKQDDLGSVQALNRTFEISERANIPKHFDIEPIRVEDYTGNELFDIDDIEIASETHGLNFEFTTTIDLTNLISDQRQIFANLIGMQVAAVVLEKIFHSTRTNAIKKETRDLALFELKGTDENRETGLLFRLEKAIEETEFDLSALDSLTLPVREGFQFTDF
ncbi:MAG: hypothetical protein ACUZ8E_05645 [Candidatus Anammoxibacter sp.]